MLKAGRLFSCDLALVLHFMIFMKSDDLVALIAEARRERASVEARAQYLESQYAMENDKTSEMVAHIKILLDSADTEIGLLSKDIEKLKILQKRLAKKGG